MIRKLILIFKLAIIYIKIIIMIYIFKLLKPFISNKFEHIFQLNKLVYLMWKTLPKTKKYEIYKFKLGDKWCL